MTMTRAREIVRAEQLRDPLYLAARGCLYLGLAFSSVLVVRVGALTVGDAFLLLSIGLVCISRALNRSVAWTPSPYPVGPGTILFMLFIGGATLSAASAILPGESLTVVARLLLVIFVLPWLGRTLLPSRTHLTRAAGWFVAGAMFCASGTVMQYLIGPEVIPGAAVTNVGRFSGWTGHVSDMGGIASAGIAIALGFLIGKRRRAAKMWSLLAVGVLTIGLVLSGSVSGMIAAVAGVMVYVARWAIKIGHAILLGVLALGVFSVASSIQSSVDALDPWERVMQALGFTEQGRYSTSESRMDTYAAAWEHIIANPLVGNGFDSLSVIADGVFPAHNLVIGALFQGGVLVAVVVVAMTLRPFRGRWMKADRSLITTQLAAGAISVIVFAMTAPSLYNRYFWMPIALLGVAKAIEVASNGRKDRAQ